MINSYYKIFQKIKFFSFFLFSMTFLSCGSFSTSGYLASDGIYGTKNQVKTNQNGIYYKNYFDQKAQEYGLNNQVNDSIITDVDSYSNTTNGSNVAYTNSYGSWGDNPTINFIYRDSPFYGSYWGNYYQPYYMHSWYNYFYSPFYSPFYSWHYYPYEGYGRYNYWDFMFRPWGYGGYLGYGGYYDSYYRYNENNVAFMNGRRSSNSNNSSSSTGSANSSSYSSNIGSRSISNYNVGRNDTDDSSSQDEVNKTRNINRMYYVLKNSRSVRNYIIPRDGDELGGNNGSGNDSRPYTGSSSGKQSSNFQLSKYGNSSSRSYNVSRSSSGSNNNSSSSGRSYDVSRSNSSSSSSSRPSYSPSSSSSSRSSGGGRPTPSSSSGGSSKGPR